MALLWALATWAHAHEPAPRSGQAQGLDYLVLQTQGGGDDDALPMVVALHPSGSDPAWMVPAFSGLPVRAHIVLPRGPYPRPNGSSWFPKDYGDLPAADQARLVAAVEARLAAFIDQMQQRYPGQGRPLLTGVSYGGDLALLLVLHHPQDYAAAFPVAARLLPEWQRSAVACADACPPIHALHGRDDATVPMASTEAALQSLASPHRQVSMTGYAGTGHDFSPAMQADLRAAIAAQIRAMTAGK